MDKRDINLYLKRIGLDFGGEIPSPDAELLRKIQYAHVTTVPYENLDLIYKIPLLLEPKPLFDKIVNHGRGGYCFEINCLLTAFLDALGYTTTNYMARYLRNEEGVPMRRHRIIITESELTEGKYIMDAGIGDRAPRYPLKFEEGLIQQQFGETYRITYEDFYGWVVEDFHKGNWGRFYSFTEELQTDLDYVMPSFYCEAHPDSKFNKTNIISLKTATGRKTISDMTFRVFDGADVVERQISDQTELTNILAEHFGIVIK